MKPFELPGYEIIEKIGEGGMATVWKARQVSLDRLVAIKVLSKQAAPDKEALERFRLEAQAAARINHHGIVQVYDAGQVDGLPYYVMEFIEGCSVGDLLERKGRLSERNALLIAEGIALGLGYAWEKSSIIHCDVKPDNILVERDGSVKVADLGLARFIVPRTDGTDDHLIIGTPNYSSPEQAQGVPDLDCRSDIYSLGAMLYHMVTGTIPFAGTVGSAAMDKHITDHLPDPIDVAPEVSQAMAWLIEKLMIKDRSLRPQSWVGVLYDLKEIKEGRFPTKLPEAGLSTVLRSSKRHIEQEPEDVPKKDASDTASGVRRKIVISKDDFEQVRAAPTPRAFETDRALLTLLLLGGVAFGVYWFFLRAEPGPAQAEPVPEPVPAATQPAPVEAPPPEPVKEPEAAPAPEPASEPPVAQEEEPAPDAEPAKTSSDSEPITWDNAAFAEGARLFNTALMTYDHYRNGTKHDPATLKLVERDVRRALNLFDSVKHLAPEGVRMDELTKQCYRLLSDVRQSMLMAPGPDVPAPSWSEKPAPAPTPPPAPKPAPPAPKPAATNAAVTITSAAPASVSATATNGPAAESAPVPISLSQLWASKPAAGDTVSADLFELLSPYGKAQVNLKGDTRITLYGPVKFMMPAKEAAKALNAPLPTGRLLDTAGFPAHSIWSYTFTGAYGDGFNQLVLLADSAERVIGVQLINDHPDALWLDPNHFNDRWRTHNFIDGRNKGGRKWRIAHRVRYMEATLQVDSELVAFDEKAPAQLGKPKERVMLILPHQVVDLILYRIEKGR
jgi:serine/threonine protein kinase